MYRCKYGRKAILRRSREGAWIEINSAADYNVKLGSRSREGAWIEIKPALPAYYSMVVAPARERGLKWLCVGSCCPSKQSLPRGSVD